MLIFTDFVTIPLRVNLADLLCFETDVDVRQLSVEILKGEHDIKGYELYILLFGHKLAVQVTKEIFVDDMERLVHAIEAVQPGCKIMISSLVPNCYLNTWNHFAYFASKSLKAWAREEGVIYADLYKRMARKDFKGLVPFEFLDESELVLTQTGFAKAVEVWGNKLSSLPQLFSD